MRGRHHISWPSTLDWWPWTNSLYGEKQRGDRLILPGANFYFYG
ncbi:hypothetical protein [Picosynechococcus sp. PCC 11901]|nr:hypothetical protein [Picosynechococcus sp. PCC 11901]